MVLYIEQGIVQIGERIELGHCRIEGFAAAAEKIADDHKPIVDADVLAQITVYTLGLQLGGDVRMAVLFAERFVHRNTAVIG